TRPPCAPALESFPLAPQPRERTLALRVELVGLGPREHIVLDRELELVLVLPRPAAHVRIDHDVEAVLDEVVSRVMAPERRHEVDVPEGQVVPARFPEQRDRVLVPLPFQHEDTELVPGVLGPAFAPALHETVAVSFG